MRRCVVLIACLSLAGCGSKSVETSYGHMRGKSLNGTGALAALFREQGHEVRAAVRLTDELDEWADVIVRFAPYAGPPEREEAEWFTRWLSKDSAHQMIYVPRDYDAESDYWEAVLAGLPQNADPALSKRAETLRDRARNWSDRIPERPKEKDVADARYWFAVSPAQQPPRVVKTLEGPWAKGIDPAKAALVVHDTLKVETENVLLTSQESPLAMSWTLDNGSQVLVVANASFLVNAALANPARRLLTLRTVHWVGEEPLRVALVEGRNLFKDGDAAMPTIWDVFRRLWEFRWVMVQMAVLGLFACLARAARLGRPRPEPPSGADRPVAHPEALGTLLARAGQADEARALLDAYRKWRYPSRVSPPPPGTGEIPLKTELQEL